MMDGNDLVAFNASCGKDSAMKRLLIGYDGSPCAEAALAELSRAGLPPELEVLVLSVAEVWLPANPDAPAATVPPAVSRAVLKAREESLQLLESSRQLAARAAERLQSLQPNWRVTSGAVADSPGWALVFKAGEWRADLVMVGSHGRSSLERIFLGGVSQKVAAEAPCSVHIARPRRHTHHTRLRVVVAVDGSRESQAAVESLAARVWPAFSEFHIVTVLDARMEAAVGWPGLFHQEWFRPQDVETRQGVDRMLESAAKKLFDAGLAVETFLLRGEPKAELLAHADGWESDLIFLGARGLNHGQRLALGTLASAVAARAHCSVEIVRAG